MSARLTWFKRQFNFDYPVDFYPDIIERLRGTPARLADRLAGLSPNVLTRRDGETWSIQENAGHLLDLDELHMGRIDDFLAGVKVLRAADTTNRKTQEAGHNSRPIADILRDFRRERMRFVARVEGLRPEDFARTAEHPRLKTPMRLVDCLTFFACHDDYHLARITELIQLFGAKPQLT